MRLLPALLFILAPAPAFAALSAAEQKMATTVDIEATRSLATLEALVNINSGTLNLAGVEKVGKMVRSELEPLDFVVRWVPMADTRRAGHLIATHKGDGRGNKLLLIAHLDTVFEKDSPFQKFAQKGTKAEGPGAGDDKGGIVVMLSALRAMMAAGTLKGADIEIVMTGDEEDPGQPLATARRDLIEAGKRANVALDFEGLVIEGGRDMGSIARRSASSWTLITTAKGGHSGGVFSAESGDGAVYAIAKIVTAFRTELPEPNLTFNVGLIAGGTQAAFDAAGIKALAAGKTNVIAAQAIARGDLRTLSDEQTSRVRTKMKEIVARAQPGAKSQIVFEEDGYPAMAPTDGNRALLAKLNMINADMGLPEMAPLDPAKRGAGDISFVAKDVDGLVGLGAAGSGQHAPGETVDLDSIARQAKRAAILMSRLSRERPAPRPGA